MTDYGKVVGKFVAPVAQAGVYGEACQGHVDFVPRLTLARTQELIILPATIQCPLGPTGELTWKGELGVDLRATYDAATDTAASHVPADLSGRMVLGAYTDGTNTTSATVGEVAIFGAALTDDQVAGLQRALARKWS